MRRCVTYTGWLFDYFFLPASRVVRRTSLGLAVQQTDFLSLRRVSCVAASLILAGCLIIFFRLRRTSCVAGSLRLASLLINVEPV